MPIPQYDQGASDRGRTTKLWRGFEPSSMYGNPRQGMFFFDDFTAVSPVTADEYSNGRMYTEATAGRVILVDDEDYGVIAIGGATAADNNGQIIFYPGVTVTPAVGNIIAFETRLKLNTITTGCQLFAGLLLTTLDATPVSAGAIHADATDYIGFHTLDLLAVNLGAEDGGVAATTTVAHTLVEDTYVKLGFRVNGASDVEMYVNGAKVDNNIAAGDICIGTTLRLCLANLSEANDASLASFDWVGVAASN